MPLLESLRRASARRLLACATALTLFAASFGTTPSVTADEGSLNTPPEGFTLLFNGKDLTGWQGLLARPNDNPAKRAELSPEERAKLQAEADETMKAHWSVADGVIVFDGKGASLQTAKDYRNFELYVDWLILPAGDSGIYLRGTPQVQIWDAEKETVGSGGLFNNKIGPSQPSVTADKPVGQWNTFFIRMIDDKVTVFLNGTQVVNDVVLENYWDRSKPIFERGPIELQNHGNTLRFRNIYLRELPDDLRDGTASSDASPTKTK